jgi:hypothetical protein
LAKLLSGPATRYAWNGNAGEALTAAAKKSGMPVRSLRYRLAKVGIEEPIECCERTEHDTIDFRPEGT